MLPAEILDLLQKWWKARPIRRDAGVSLATIPWQGPGATPVNRASKQHFREDALRFADQMFVVPKPRPKP